MSEAAPNETLSAEPPPIGSGSYRARLAAEASRVRAGGGLGKSDMLDRLFGFLLDRSMEGRVPKEFEIADEVFGKGPDIDTMQDASVRVYIHRLRRKLAEHYALTDPPGDRLVVPRGAYRLELIDEAPPPEADAPALPSAGEGPVPGRAAPPSARRRWRWWLVTTVLAVGLAGWAVFNWLRPVDPVATAAASPVWRPIAADSARTLVVTGDYYIFGEAPDGLDVKRLVREFSINSREDLDNFVMAHPETAGRYVDVDLHYLPVSIGAALSHLLPIATVAAARVARPRVLPMSELTPEMLKTANVVYVGFLSGLGLLRGPLFDGSGFQIGASYDELVDRASGRRFTSDWGPAPDDRTPRRDYAFIAGIPGPAGTRVLIVAGTRDPAVMQAADIVADPQQLARLRSAADGQGGFEALYEVRTLGNVDLGSRLIVARPLHAMGLWQGSKATRHFPDQLPRER